MLKINQLKEDPVVFPPPKDEFDELIFYRSEMLRFAINQLRNEHVAEDVVQETLEDAFNGLNKFEKRSQLKTWLFSILVNKIRDEIRRKKRSPITEVDTSFSENDLDDYFDTDNSWCEEVCPAHWNTPESLLSSQQFLVILQACLDHLPESTSQVFLMREVTGLDTKEVCEELGISENNCAQILFRARLGLTQCLGQRWFESGER